MSDEPKGATLRAPEVTDAEVERACELYVARLANVDDDTAKMIVRADFPDRVIAMRAVLEQFAAKGSTTPKSTPTGQRPSSEEKR